MNKWVILTTVIGILLISLLVITQNLKQETLKFGDIEITQQQFENIAEPIEENSYFQLCDIDKNKCVYIQKGSVDG